MKKNRRLLNISNAKERVILSDILPYEVPVIFSNKYFYKFLIDNKIEIKADGSEVFIKNDDIKLVVKLILNLKEDLKITENRRMPFSFKISHKENDYRKLSIIHPLNQLDVIAFYQDFKESIKYFSNISEFSIRKPYKVAKYMFYNDYIHKNKKKDSQSYNSKIEIHESEEEQFKSFFTYKKYTNIHKFFESRQYHECEKVFNKLYKFDINKCFDSIYTHTMPWAVFNKEIVKNNIKISERTFAGKFDKLMQNMNYGETNGILIGSEVSRIFAELILQQIDKNVLDELSTSKEAIHKENYRVFRYVDDYFLFYNDESIKNKIVDAFKHQLNMYNLSMNASKTVAYASPMVTPLTIAKTKITDLINKTLKYDFDVENYQQLKNYKLDKLITRFKIIVKESNIEYKDIINYSIGLLERKVANAIQDIDIGKDNRCGSNILEYFLAILKFLFFVYSVSSRVTSTIKAVSLLSKIIDFTSKCESRELSDDKKDLIYTKVNSEICKILKNNKIKKYTQNESLYLLIALTMLNRNYRLEKSVLEDYFFTEQCELNYFAITTLLFYIKDIKRYDQIKQKIIVRIKEKFEKSNKDSLKKNTELIILLLDLIACPYITDDLKKELLDSHYGIKDSNEQDKIINCNKYWFIKWTNFDLVKEMELKKSQEVYS